MANDRSGRLSADGDARRHAMKGETAGNPILVGSTQTNTKDTVSVCADHSGKQIGLAKRQRLLDDWGTRQPPGSSAAHVVRAY